MSKKEQGSYLSYKKKLAREMEERYPHYNLISNTLGFFFVLGLLLIILEIYIYRRTIIPAVTPFVVAILMGILLTPFLKKILNIYILNPFSPGHLPLPWHFLYNVVAWGGLSACLFMGINFIFTDGRLKDISTNVNTYGHFARSRQGCAESYVTITYKDQFKELIFPCNTPVEKYKLVHMEIEKGFFGFDVIKDQMLKDGDW